MNIGKVVEIMTQYRIGEITKELGVSSFTIKHYEKEGLLEPYVDKSNGYRYLDVPSIGWLLGIRRLRNLGFSLKDIQRLINSQSMSDVTEQYRAQIALNKMQIEKLLKNNCILDTIIEDYEQILNSPSNPQIRMTEAFYLLVHTSEQEIVNELIKKYGEEFYQQWRDCSVPTILIKREDFMRDGEIPHYYWTLCSQAKLLSKFDITPPVDAVFKPACTHLIYNYSQVSEKYFNPCCIAEFRRMISATGFTLAGDVHFYYLGTTVEENVVKDNYACFFPIA